jgi:cobyrinic acid a,c-diamide synthase
VKVACVIVNRVASERHRTYVADAIAAAGVTVAGSIGRDDRFALPSRHLGLVQAGEHDDLDARLERIADEVERMVDLDALLSLATGLPSLAPGNSPALPPPGNRIALARDEAFSFVYPHVLAGWRAAGAAIVPFSPLADEAPPEDCDCCWLPGGYPELHAGRLAAAHGFREGLRRFAATRPVHGECGGYMALGEGLEDAEGRLHAMAGLLGHVTSFARRRLTLGYREARFAPDGAVFSGVTIRGHEFHYATVTDGGADVPLADVADGQGRRIGPAGGRRGHVSGTFFHAIAAG